MIPLADDPAEGVLILYEGQPRDRKGRFAKGGGLPANWKDMPIGDKADHVYKALSKVKLQNVDTGSIVNSKKSLRHVICNDGFEPKAVLMSREKQFAAWVGRSKARTISNDPGKPYVSQTWQMIFRVRVNGERFWVDALIHRHEKEAFSRLYHVRLSKNKPNLKK